MPRTNRRAALLLLTPLPAIGCVADLPHQWTNAQFAWTTHSAFAPLQTDAMFEGDCGRQIAALFALFGVAALPALDVYVHDDRGAALGSDAQIAGWHHADEIHLYASWDGARLGLPSPGSDTRFRHELVHALHQAAGLEPPRWLEEGVCEVLSVAAVDDGGKLVLIPHAEREREMRRLRADGRWLDAAALLAVRRDYPDPALMSPLYAEGTAFASFLLANGTPTAARLRTLAALPDREFAARFSVWSKGPARAPVAELLAPFAAHRDAAVRRAIAEHLGAPTADAAWWSMAASLLVDADEPARTSVRVAALYRPVATETNVAHFRAWARSDDHALQLAGHIALAQCGDLDAAIAYAGALRGSRDAEWWQPTLWLALSLPPRFVDPAIPDADRSRGEAEYLRDWGQGLARALAAARTRLTWDAPARRWHLDG